MKKERPDTADYIPTPAEIARECELIRSEWTETQRLLRDGYRVLYVPRVCRVDRETLGDTIRAVDTERRAGRIRRGAVNQHGGERPQWRYFA